MRVRLLPGVERGRAFERFWRGSPPGGGSGLGLAIVAQLAAASGGTARLEPREGGGLDASAAFLAAPERSGSG